MIIYLAVADISTLPGRLSIGEKLLPALARHPGESSRLGNILLQDPVAWTSSGHGSGYSPAGVLATGGFSQNTVYSHILPCCINNLLTPVSPDCRARHRGVRPSLLAMSARAPFSSSRRTACGSP